MPPFSPEGVASRVRKQEKECCCNVFHFHCENKGKREAAAGEGPGKNKAFVCLSICPNLSQNGLTDQKLWPFEDGQWNGCFLGIALMKMLSLFVMFFVLSFPHFHVCLINFRWF